MPIDASTLWHFNMASVHELYTCITTGTCVAILQCVRACVRVRTSVRECVRACVRSRLHVLMPAPARKCVCLFDC